MDNDYSRHSRVLLELASLTLAEMLARGHELGLDGKSGLYFWHSWTRSLLPLGINLIGDTHEEKTPLWFVFCQEKAQRLVRRRYEIDPTVRGGLHISSFQSADDEKKQYGGAVVCGPLILSASGLTQAGDEVFALALALKCRLIDQEYARRVVEIHSDEYPEYLAGVRQGIRLFG